MTGPPFDPASQYPGLMSPVTPPQMFAHKPSILDRVAARLFPTGAYQGLLDPQAQQGLQRQAFQQVGTGLLQLGGRRPYQAGTLANIGAALGGAQQNFPQMADQALQLQAYKGQLAQQQAISQVSQNHPATPGMSQSDQYQRFIDIAGELATIPGGAAIAEKMAPLIAAMKPDKPTAPREGMRIDNVRDNRIGSSTHGMTGTALLNPDNPQGPWLAFQPQVQTADQPPKPTPQQGQNAEFGAQALAAWQPVEKLRTENPNVETEVGRIMASPAFTKAVPLMRNAGDAVQALQKAGASDAAQQYMRAKWAFVNTIVRTRYPGSRMSGAMLQQIGNEFLPSLDPAANAQVRQNELQAILTAQGESGYDLNPSIWNNAVKRHGVANIDLQALLAGTSGFQFKYHRPQ